MQYVLEKEGWKKNQGFNGKYWNCDLCNTSTMFYQQSYKIIVISKMDDMRIDEIITFLKVELFFSSPIPSPLPENKILKIL